MNQTCRQLQKKNNELEKSISKENDEIYTNMILYLRSADISEYDQELVRGDLIALILDGQQRGDNIQQIMGNRYREICDEILEVLPKRTKKEKLMEYLECSLCCICILGIIHMFSQLIALFGRRLSEYRFVLTTGNIISMIMIVLASNLIVTFISKHAFEEESSTSKFIFWKNGILGLLLLAVIICSNVYFTMPVISMHMITAVIFIAVLFAAERILSGKNNH